MFYNLLNEKYSFIFNDQKGASAIIVAIVLAILLGFSALAIDVGYMYATRNELQNVADAAALAACGKLGRIYLGIPISDQSTYDVDDSDNGYEGRSAINIVANQVALNNKAAGDPITIRDEDIFIGKWDWTEPDLMKALDPTQNVSPDAVRVIARRDSLENHPVATFFGKIFSVFGASHDTFESLAVATAALSGPTDIDEGELKLPVGLSFHNFPNNCKDTIELNPADSCAQWHNFFDPHDPASMNDTWIEIIESHVMEDHIPTPPDGITNGSAWLTKYFTIPENKAPDCSNPDDCIIPGFDLAEEDVEFEFTGGVAATLIGEGGQIVWENTGTDENPIFDTAAVNPDGSPVIDGDSNKPTPFVALYDYFRMRDGDENNNEWTSLVPVYDDDPDGCNDASKSRKVIGLAEVVIEMPNGPPDNDIEIHTKCEMTVVEARGGGSNYGTVKGTIPSLVQ